MKAALIMIKTLILLVLLGCTPQKRLTRLINKHPELLTKTDTITVTDTITFTTPKVSKDSVWLISSTKDTIVLREQNLTIRTYINGDTVYVSGECDTIYQQVIQEHKVPYKVIEYASTKWYYKTWNLIKVAITIYLIWLLINFTIKYLKKKSRFF